jgi:hypothetical protein
MQQLVRFVIRHCKSYINLFFIYVDHILMVEMINDLSVGDVRVGSIDQPDGDFLQIENHECIVN